MDRKMATLEHFLKTGQLGPICLGMRPNEVTSFLGDPDDESRKKKPLILKYGGLQLAFLRHHGDKMYQLMQIALYFQPKKEPLPDPVKMTDWVLEEAPTERDFRSFLDKIAYLPVHRVDGAVRHFTLLSGLRAFFSDGMLHSLQLSQREKKEPVPLSDEREPSTEQIVGMFDEATRVVDAGSPGAGLLLAWAGLEAVLRRAALQAGLQGRIGVQPNILARELFAAGKLDTDDAAFLEQMRQTRTAIVHGLAPVPIKPDLVDRIVNLARRFLSDGKNGQPT
jgi:hypothetical protein